VKVKNEIFQGSGKLKQAEVGILICGKANIKPKLEETKKAT
jgi:hypothetical protein